MNDFTFLRRAELPGTGTVHNLSTNPTEMTAFASQGVTILDTQGDIQISRGGKERWMLAQTNMVLSAGDHLRTGRRSGATLRWPDNSLVRVNQLTVMEVLSPASKNLKRPSSRLNDGTIQIFNEDGTTNTIRVITRGATAAIKG